MSKLPFPSQSYLWKNGFRIFVNLAKDFSEAHRGEYCVADWPVSTDVTNRYEKEKERGRYICICIYLSLHRERERERERKRDKERERQRQRERDEERERRGGADMTIWKSQREWGR